jgi:hypothetical protein
MKSLIVMTALMLAVPAAAQPASGCFSIRDYQNWKSPDARTIYIKVAGDRYYRLDLAADCSGLQWPGVHLLTKSRSSMVCDALDWDITASTRTFGQPGGMEMKCIVKTMTPLTPAEVTAIPPKFKP